MEKRTGLAGKLTMAVFAVVMMLAVLPFMMPGRSTAYAAAVKNVTKAKTIALKDAGFKESAVTIKKAVLDKEDNEWEIKFQKGDYKYEYTISAKNGRIEEKDYEIITVKKSSGQKQISKSKAKKIALKGAKQSAVKKLKIKKKTYRSKAKVWEVSFKKGKGEWEYKIDRYSGKILEMEYEYNK